MRGKTLGIEKRRDAVDDGALAFNVLLLTEPGISSGQHRVRLKLNSATGRARQGAVARADRFRILAEEAAGASKANIFRTETFVSNKEEFLQHAEVWAKYLGPVRLDSATVEEQHLKAPDTLVEIQVVALLN